VSDHIFLAATMLICLHTEAICIMSDILQGMRREVSGQEVALTFAFVVAIFLYLFTAADMYFTAKYFHFQLESATTLVAVFLLFQLPVLTWLARKRVLVAVK
jgi:high-affinity K+ transport system ATPase subunit B